MRNKKIKCRVLAALAAALALCLPLVTGCDWTYSSEPYEKEPPWPEAHWLQIMPGRDFGATMTVTGMAADELHTLYWDLDGGDHDGVRVNGEYRPSGSEFLLAETGRIPDGHGGYTRSGILDVTVTGLKEGGHVLRLHLTNRRHNHNKLVYGILVQGVENPDDNLVVGVDVTKKDK